MGSRGDPWGTLRHAEFEFDKVPEYESWRFELEQWDRQELREIVQGTQHFQTSTDYLITSTSQTLLAPRMISNSLPQGGPKGSRGDPWGTFRHADLKFDKVPEYESRRFELEKFGRQELRESYRS